MNMIHAVVGFYHDRTVGVCKLLYIRTTYRARADWVGVSCFLAPLSQEVEQGLVAIYRA